MKKNFFFLIVIVSFAMASGSCNKENLQDDIYTRVTIIAGSPSRTKTHFDHMDPMQIKWDMDGEKMVIIEDEWNENNKRFIPAEKCEILENGLYARFTDVSLHIPNDDSYYGIWGVYPSSSVDPTGQTTTDADHLELILPDVQYPVLPDPAFPLGSFDPEADLLISKMMEKEDIRQDKSLMMYFNRPVALVDLQITPRRNDGIDNVVENIEKIVFSANYPLAGRASVDLTQAFSVDESCESYIIRSDINQPRKITLDYTGRGLKGKVDNTIYSQFMAFPGDLDDFKVSVYTERSVYTKEYRGTGQKLEANTRLTLNLTLRPENREKKTYRLLDETTGQYFSLGDEVIFVARDDASGHSFVMRGPEGNHMRGDILEILDNSIEANDIPDNVSVFDVVNVAMSQTQIHDSYSFYHVDEHKYLSGGANSLRLESSNDWWSGTWTVSDDSGFVLQNYYSGSLGTRLLFDMKKKAFVFNTDTDPSQVLDTDIFFWDRDNGDWN